MLKAQDQYSLTADRLKEIDEYTELLTFGYFHALTADDKTPIDVIDICSLYSLEFDQFDQHNNEIEISFLYISLHSQLQLNH